MLKLTFKIFLGTFCALLLASVVQAGPNINEFTGGVAEKAGYDQTVSDTTLSETAGRIISAVMSFIGVIFLGLTVYAGFLWMTASGNEERVTKAQGILKASVIGLVIVVAAYSLTYFVLGLAFGSLETSGGTVGGSSGGGFWSSFADGFRNTRACDWLPTTCD